jgi:hypothetical protein
MAFSDTNISNVRLTRTLGGTVVQWDSTDAAGTIFQAYVDGMLVASTTARLVHLPPAARGRSRTIQVGAVGAGEGTADLSSSLPTAPTTGDRAKLTWYGGTYLSDTIAGFKIYRSATSGGAVSYTTPVATVAAYPAGIPTDGFGVGRFGGGGFGRSEAAYTWRSDPLPTGTWRFGVAAYDAAGNQVSSPSEIDVDIVALPKPPGATSAGRRISYTYNSGSRVAVLPWTAGA